MIIIENIQQEIEKIEATQKAYYEQGIVCDGLSVKKASLLNLIESMKTERIANAEKVKAERAKQIKYFLIAFCFGVIISAIVFTLFSLF